MATKRHPLDGPMTLAEAWSWYCVTKFANASDDMQALAYHVFYDGAGMMFNLMFDGVKKISREEHTAILKSLAAELDQYGKGGAPWRP